MKFPLILSLFLLTTLSYAQSNCNPVAQVNFPGGRVILSFDGNVHDDDDIVALPYALGMWWAAGLKDRVVQVEYNNHVCDFSATESDGSGAGYGDDSQNMRVSAQGAISRFGYESSRFFDYETQGVASTQKMASEIEASTASNKLWILAGGPMETVWRALDAANSGHQYVTIISHSAWNQNHQHCSNANTWASLKSSFESRGVFFVENCSGGSCGQTDELVDQNGGFNSAVSNWVWMQNSSKEYNRWIFSRNPFGNSYFDPSDAGMSYFLITGGPFNGGDKRGDHNDARNLMENPCQDNAGTVSNTPPSVNITTPSNNDNFTIGSTVTIALNSSDPDGSLTRHQIFVNGSLKDTDGAFYTPHIMTDLQEGSYTVQATVTDNQGLSSTDSVTFTIGNSSGNSNPEPPGGTGNGTDPLVSITSPQTGTVTPGSTVIISISASDPDGSIQKHQVYVNDILVDTDGANYTPHTIKNIAGGTYTIRVKVTDNQGNTASDTVDITAGGSNPSPPPLPDPDNGPDLSFLTPQNGDVVPVGSDVTVNLNASSSNGAIIKHQLYVNNTLVDTDGSTFTPHVITNIQAGTHVIRATITDFYGQKTTQSVTISAGATNQAAPQNPTVGFISPSNGQSFAPGSNVSINLSAQDLDGVVTKYQIYINNALVDTDLSSFTPHIIKNITQGTYILKAIVTDNDANTGSAEIVIYSGNSGSSQVMGRSVFQSRKTGLPLKVRENPVKDSVLKLEQEGNKYYVIYTLEGEILQAAAIDGNPRNIDIPLEKFSSGLYLILTDKASSKFIIE